ncbi:beta-aspartyl-peptidase [Halomonas sp. MCCC 1A17488]|uniref:beta-aspartyl-peptidase n=1 Tax=unclassified Halomonas TaxID=2609666 RepID=UPI0018D24D01|nr:MULTISPECIES: beta-aspartyl-peptidase [unclassified Halomonas]MCE8017631.1 beta-aspartyl-peptidase [Halomonas sp. MCCC 1A17488]MCG3240964.1 beta-aspartyl-peptidase [Halomonas sp. MCCC 1A17488]QPP48834.1 beta-aspartyl-peptidase [Halomonas sp. SS10-MC5]
MLTLLKNARLYAPRAMGLCHLLIADRRIAAVVAADEGAPASGMAVEEIDLEGRRVIPGLVDPLVHFIGGGGEGGFGTRTAELTLADALASGVTTLVGALGTDALTRTPANLLGKARELAAGGLTTYCYTGSYQLPPVTLTGSVGSDILYIPEFIGLGEVAISDHRGSQPSAFELARLASEARTAGMLAGKSGIVFIHTGDAPSHLEPLRAASRDSAIPLAQFLPTHINRTAELFEDGLRFAREGGRIDFTTSTTAELLAGGEIAAAEAVARALHARVEPSRITLSSDANASLPRFDAERRFIGLEPGRLASLFEVLGECVDEQGIALEQAIGVASTHAADALGLAAKGRLEPGRDADLLVLAEDAWAIDEVWSLGRRVHRRD